MSYVPRLGRSFLLRSGLVAFAVTTVGGSIALVTNAVEQRSAWADPRLENVSGGTLILGHNAGNDRLALLNTSTNALSLPWVSSLSPGDQSLLGLLLLGSTGFLASIRPFDSKGKKS
jgi:uncharacterized protein YigA (DUF484 family)